VSDERLRARSLSFGAVASLYERVRPSYPVAAARWILGERPGRVVDLGAGTGKFTRVVASLGHEVVAVEPDPAMLAALEAATPGVRAVPGSAGAIPLPDASVDAVVAAQSYHWFDSDGSRVEIARVLRPGGVLGPIWNLRDDAVPWVAELTRTVLEEDGTSADERAIESFGPLFGAVQRAEFRHSAEHDRESLRDLVRSRSKYLVADEAERRRMDDAVDAIAAGLPEAFELPYVTIAYRAARL
jgi:SAM-dependent methyltransferase